MSCRKMRLKAISGIMLTLLLIGMIILVFNVHLVESLESGIIGYWKFDEGSGTTTYDISGNSNHGTHYGNTRLLVKFDEGSGTTTNDESPYDNDGMINGAIWIGGISNFGLSFDGIDDYVNVSSSSGDSLNPSSQIALEAWIKRNTNTPSGSSDLIIGRMDTSSTRTYYLSFRNDKLQMEISEDGTTADREVDESTSTITDTNWHHVVGTFDGSTIKLYIDGVYDCEETPMGDATSINQNPSDVIIGYDVADDGYYFNGMIDEVAIYSKALSADEIFDHYNAEKAKFTDWVDGKYEKALSFDGTNDYVRIPDSTSFPSGTQDFTISAWVRPDGLAGDHRVILANQNLDHFQLALNNGGTSAKINVYLGGGGEVSTPSLSWTLGNWYHIAATRNGSTVKIYRNAVEEGSGSNSNSITRSAIDIGYRAATGHHPWNGTIDEVRVYNRALSSEEIEDQFLGLVGYWKFDEVDGDIAYDSSGNGKDITLYGNPAWVSGLSGNALEFDGSDDYGTYPALYASSPTSIKVQALIYPHDLYGTLGWAGGYITLIHGSPGVFVAGAQYGNVEFGVKLTTGGWHTIVAKTTINAWHNFTGIWTRGGHLWLYLDEVLVVARTIPDYGLVAAGPTTIGSYGGSRNFFDGIIDEVKVYTNVSPPPPPSNFWTLTTSTSSPIPGEYGATTLPFPGTYMYHPGTVVNVAAKEDTGGQYVFDHWELNGTNVGSQNPYPLTMNANYALHAVFVTAPYDVTINAYCYTEATAVSVGITMDGAPTGYNTPHTFTGLTGTHTFTVPDIDQNGHPFKQWSTGETSATITVSTGGTYTVYYEWEAGSPYDVTINAYCYTESTAVNVGITMDGTPGYNTPHTFTGLTGTHTFTVPSPDPHDHPFNWWSTGETSATITVSTGGTYTAYYGWEAGIGGGLHPCILN